MRLVRWDYSEKHRTVKSTAAQRLSSTSVYRNVCTNPATNCQTYQYDNILREPVPILTETVPIIPEIRNYRDGITSLLLQPDIARMNDSSMDFLHGQAFFMKISLSLFHPFLSLTLLPFSITLETSCSNPFSTPAPLPPLARPRTPKRSATRSLVTWGH